MMGKTHAAGGFLAGSTALLLSQNHIPELLTVQTGIVVGLSTLFFATTSARLPDIDKKDSTIGRRLWFISWPIYILQCLIKIPSYFGIKTFKPISKTIDHRGFTHFPFTWLLLTSLAAVLYSIVSSFKIDASVQYLILSPAAGFCIGILSHIILDFFSGKIKVFAPLSLKGYGFPIFKRNGILEYVLMLTMYIYSFNILYKFTSNIVKTSL